MTVQPEASVYPVRLEVDYPDQHNRVTTFFRVFMVIPAPLCCQLVVWGVLGWEVFPVGPAGCSV